MKTENQISVYKFAVATGYSVNQVYQMGKNGRIKIEVIAGKKSIDKVKYPPEDHKKKIK